MIFYYNWKLNDYRLLANVNEYNDRMKKYKELREKAEIQRQAIKNVQDKMSETARKAGAQGGEIKF